MGKRSRPGKGAQARNRAKADRAWLARREADGTLEDFQNRFRLHAHRPRRLTVANEADCRFAVDYASHVARELRAIKQAQERYRTDDSLEDEERYRSCFGFFGKSTLLLEAMCPATEGTPHLSTRLGVAGCGKSTFLADLLLDIYAGTYLDLTGPEPSLLLASTTNEQVKKLWIVALAAHDTPCSRVPKPVWCVSETFRTKSKEHNDVLVLRAATQAYKPCKNQVIVCTHDLALGRFSGAYFQVVILDEIGGLDRYKGCSLVGLATRMAKLLGDPLQGSRPCPSLADGHWRTSAFSHHSFRCPELIMQIVQPAYACFLTNLRCSLQASRIRNLGAWTPVSIWMSLPCCGRHMRRICW